MQDCSISSASTLEILQSCTKPSNIFPKLNSPRGLRPTATDIPWTAGCLVLCVFCTVCFLHPHPYLSSIFSVEVTASILLPARVVWSETTTPSPPRLWSTSREHACSSRTREKKICRCCRKYVWTTASSFVILFATPRVRFFCIWWTFSLQRMMCSFYCCLHFWHFLLIYISIMVCF